MRASKLAVTVLLTLALAVSLAAPEAAAPATGELLSRGDLVGAIQPFRERETPDARYVTYFITPRSAWMLVPGMPSLGDVPPASAALQASLSAYSARPARWDLLGKVADAALAEHHPDVLVAALKVALERGPLPDPHRLKTVTQVRNLLLALSWRRQVRRIAPLLKDVPREVELGPTKKVSEAELLLANYALAGDGVIFSLSEAILARGEARDGGWETRCGDQARLAIRVVRGRATITDFHVEPSVCDWEILRGERTAKEVCKFLPVSQQTTVPPRQAEPPPPETAAALPPWSPSAGPPVLLSPPPPPQPPRCPWRQPAGPVVAFTALDGDAGIFVKQFVDGRWQSLGTPRGAGRQAKLPALALGPDGEPAIAYAASAIGAAGRVVAFERWSGGAWREVDGSAGPGGVSGLPDGRDDNGAANPALAIDCESRPTIAWDHMLKVSTGVYQIHLRARRYDGRWQDLGEPPTDALGGTTSAAHPAVAVDASGAPLMFWNAERSPESAVVGRRWSGTQWEDIAGSARGLPGSRQNGDPTVAVNDLGQPVVIWPLCPGVAVRGALLDGAAWRPFGGGTSTCEGMAGQGYPVTVDAGGWPVVVYQEVPFMRLRVLRVESHGFVDLGTPQPGASGHASIQRYGDGLVVAWSDRAGIHVSARSGEQWAPLGESPGPGRFDAPVLAAR